MHEETLRAQMREVHRLREYLDSSNETHSAAETKRDVFETYGRSVSRTTWGRWCDKCGIDQELLAMYGGAYPAGAYLLLRINAKLLRGNGPCERSRKVSRLTLVNSVRKHRKFAAPVTDLNQLPEQTSYQEMIERAEAQANREYHIRTHEKRGILKGKASFDRHEAAEILAKYPVFRIGA